MYHYESTTPEQVRRSRPLNVDKLKEAYSTLRRVEVKIEKQPTPAHLRRVFGVIRQWRFEVAGFLIPLKARVAELRGDLIRIDRVIAYNTNEILSTNEGLLGTKNAQERTARIKSLLDKWYDAKALLEEEIQILAEAVSSAMIVREELRYAYEEASRSLASIELEYKIEMKA